MTLDDIENAGLDPLCVNRLMLFKYTTRKIERTKQLAAAVKMLGLILVVDDNSFKWTGGVYERSDGWAMGPPIRIAESRSFYAFVDVLEDGAANHKKV